MIRWMTLVCALALAACAGQDETCDPTSEACELDHGFGLYTIEAGGETDGICMSWTLNNPEPLWVNTVAIDNDGGFHHSNWFFVPDNRWELPDGHWSCRDNGFEELAATVFGGVLYAQSTQVTAESQRFAAGAAVRIPPYSRIVANTHVLNASDQALATEMRVKLSTIPPDEVTAPLTPLRLTYFDLTLPPRAKSQFGASCDLGPTHERIAGGSLDLKLHYILPHYHYLGYRFDLRLSGGPDDGENLYALDAAWGEPLGHTFDPPIDFAARGATGVHFACGFDNPRDVEVGWGIGDQEMCVALGFAETTVAFDGSVDLSTGSDVAPDGTVMHQGACNVIGTLYEQDK